MDFQIARSLAAEIVSAPAFSVLTESDADRAAQVVLRAGALLVACEQFGAANDAAKALISIAKEKNIPVYTEVSQVPLTGSEAQNEG